MPHEGIAIGSIGRRHPQQTGYQMPHRSGSLLTSSAQGDCEQRRGNQLKRAFEVRSVIDADFAIGKISPGATCFLPLAKQRAAPLRPRSRLSITSSPASRGENSGRGMEGKARTGSERSGA